MAQNVFPALRYRDARAAIEFLKSAAGFEELTVMENDDGTIAHGELVFEGGVVMVSTLRDEETRFPGGPITMYLALDDVDAHHDRAVAAGAEVVMELTDQDYGSREYAIRDPEGSVWTFGTYRPQVSG